MLHNPNCNCRYNFILLPFFISIIWNPYYFQKNIFCLNEIHFYFPNSICSRWFQCLNTTFSMDTLDSENFPEEKLDIYEQSKIFVWVIKWSQYMSMIKYFTLKPKNQMMCYVTHFAKFCSYLCDPSNFSKIQVLLLT